MEVTRKEGKERLFVSLMGWQVAFYPLTFSTRLAPAFPKELKNLNVHCSTWKHKLKYLDILKCGWYLQDMSHAIWLTDGYRGQNSAMKQEPIQGGLKLFMCPLLYLFLFVNTCLNKICFLRKCCCDMIAQPTMMWFPTVHTITGFASFVWQLPLTTHHFSGSFLSQLFSGSVAMETIILLQCGLPSSLTPSHKHSHTQ